MSIPNPKQGPRSQALYPNQRIPAEEYNKIVTAAGLTSNQVNNVTAGLRTLKGRTFFEPNLRHKLQDLAKSLKPFYKVKLIEINSTDKTEILNPNGKV